MEKSSLSKATLGRLPLYLQFLKSLPLGEQAFISSTVIARSLSLGEVQVRKDLSAVSGQGRPKIGYSTADLIRRIETTLGCDLTSPVILVGAGKLGKALMDYGGFREFGIDILAAFDCNENVICVDGGKRPVLPMNRLGSFCRENKVGIAIITVGASSAQEVCNTLVECGIEAIWNFAPCRLEVPEGVIVRQENLALSLAYLNNQLANNFLEDKNGN